MTKHATKKQSGKTEDEQLANNLAHEGVPPLGHPDADATQPTVDDTLGGGDLSTPPGGTFGGAKNGGA